MTYQPRQYQQQAIEFLHHLPQSGLFLDPGLGKTSITLEYLRQLQDRQRVLVIAPLRVCYLTWPDEIKQWGHSFTVAIAHGSKEKRQKALRSDADIVCTNPEALPWLARCGDLKGFNVLIVDESSYFKTPSTKRFRAIRKILPAFKYRHILTGTPAPNSIADLWAQLYIIDEGIRLGRTLGWFRRQYCHLGGYQDREWIPNHNARPIIERLISSCILRLDAEECLDLPELLINDVPVALPAKARKAYKRLEQDLWFEMDGVEAIAFTGGAKYNLCRQVANGGIYATDGLPESIHDAKTDAVEAIANELQGKPLLVFYAFKHDRQRLRRRWPDAPDIGGETSAKESQRIVKDWNAGKVPLLMAHPKSIGHGLNMQKGPGRDVVWFGLTDDLELYQQANRRIYRSGVTSRVRVHRLLARGTVDMAIRRRIDSKEDEQLSLLDALKEYRDESRPLREL